MMLDSVKFWCTQLNDPGHKNTAANHSTKQLYLRGIFRFDEWLQGRSFPSYKTVWSDGQTDRESITKSFGSVEEMMQYCEKSNYGTKTAQRAIREFMANLQANKTSAGVMAITRSSIKSYFRVHDIVLDLPKPKKNRDKPNGDNSYMSLEDFYKMLQQGNPGIMMKTVILIKFQSGMDSSTLVDRFNYEGYPQIVKHFKTDDHKLWDIDRCPVPIRVVRVKTNVQYLTFIDRDAVTQLKEYLTWKEAKHGKQDITKPLFLTKQGNPIHSKWLSFGFSKVAVRAGIQEKISHRVFKIRSHAVRHLLKSILITSGCAQYAADHVLGHAPRDAYEAQAILYPEMIRAEYAKASSRINIFSKVENTLNNPKDPESLEAQIRELKAEVAAWKQSKAGEDFTDEKHKNVMNGMNEKINRLLRLFDTLPDDIKERMSDEIDGTA